MTDFDATARALESAAGFMESSRDLNPDAAVRLAVWGKPNIPYPGDDAPGADAFNEATSAIKAHCGWQANGIDRIPQGEAITAAHAEAARFRSYVGGAR